MPLDPYVQAQNTRRGGYPSSFQGGMAMPGYGGGAYGGGYRRPYMSPGGGAAEVSPAGSSNGGTGGSPEAAAGRAQQNQVYQNDREAIDLNMKNRNAMAMQDQARSIDAYRTARDNSQGAQDSREQRQTATALGIDPSSSPKDIAAAASGPVNFDDNGMPTGGSTGQTLNSPTQPRPVSTPGSVQPNEADVVQAARQVQAQRNGTNDASNASTYANAYTAGANPPAASTLGQAPTGAAPFKTGDAMTLRPPQQPETQPPFDPTGTPPAPVAQAAPPSMPKPISPFLTPQRQVAPTVAKVPGTKVKQPRSVTSNINQSIKAVP